MATKSFTLVNTHELHMEAVNDPIAYYIKYQLDVTNCIWHSLAFAIAMNILPDCKACDKNARTIAVVQEWGQAHHEEIDRCLSC